MKNNWNWNVLWSVNVYWLYVSQLECHSEALTICLFTETQLEAKAALQQALEMKKNGKREKAHKLLVHALNMNPEFVEALTELGTILEEEKDVVQADHLYTKALAISPCNEKALVSRDRTLPLVEEIDQRHFGIIDGKVRRLMSIPKGNSALRRVMEETYYHHIYHTVAIEGNTLTLSEIRHIIETRYAVPGKSLQEQNEANWRRRGHEVHQHHPAVPRRSDHCKWHSWDTPTGPRLRRSRWSRPIPLPARCSWAITSHRIRRTWTSTCRSWCSGWTLRKHRISTRWVRSSRPL